MTNSELKNMIIIRNVYPEIDGGRYPVKREIDIPLEVTVDVFSKIPVTVWLKYKKKWKKAPWNKIRMQKTSGEKYKGVIKFDDVGFYEYTIEATATKDRNIKVSYENILEVIVSPVWARYSAWYEMFHRSQGKIPGKSATFKDCEERLPEIKRMGFDVIYLPPIHPIGKTNRKGPNNTLWAGPNDPGCPWSIGDETGGHKAVHPDLGTLDDFRHFVKKCEEYGMRVALDIALNCSFDHPYIKEHPNWFFHNPDGSIKYAENPPKKYEDTAPLNFYPEPLPGQTKEQARKEMWEEMKSIFVFWIQQGVKIFRVDNPHTKPDDFWEWVIREIKKEYPDVIFLSEAFTFFEKLELLAKIGFDQSYTYFTWRNTKLELFEYHWRLTNTIVKEFLRGNLFVNTPDILPIILQKGGRPAFKFRIALASTLSSVYGMYNGYELCENEARPGDWPEAYNNSEKYQYKVWDWDRPGNIKDYIAKLNQIRRENPALHYYDNLRFYNSTNEHVLFYGKILPEYARNSGEFNAIFVAVNVNPHQVQESRITVPVEELGIGSGEEYKVRELITDKVYTWKGRDNYVRLDPQDEPVQIFRIEKTSPI